MTEPRDLDRRRFLQGLVGLSALTLGAARLWASPTAPAATAPSRGLQPTPDCDDGDEPTPSTTEGPFYTPASPLRNSLLEPGTTGRRIVLTGRVFSLGCRPVPRALLDFWQADAGGEYDNVGFKLRGHQFTDARGRFRLESVVPGLYPGRTRHFHVKVQRPGGGRLLTTQLFFPDEPRNTRDRLFRPELMMAVRPDADASAATFHFVLDTE
jgi:protocatechuate 3,4-dioxygenase beta subunit